ncbi:MAG: hypothetical protein K6L81_17620 [Agarilytica sp.]
MKHCILATQVDNHFVSIICHFDDDADMHGVLNRFHKSENAAAHLITLGDLNCIQEESISAYHRDWGYTWNQVQPVIHAHPKLLLTYSQAIGCEYLYAFENDQWDEIPLTPVHDRIGKDTTVRDYENPSSDAQEIEAA